MVVRGAIDVLSFNVSLSLKHLMEELNTIQVNFHPHSQVFADIFGSLLTTLEY